MQWISLNPMYAHLFLALVGMMVYDAMRDRWIYRRDWCGFRCWPPLLPRVFLDHLPAMMLFVVIYFELMDLLPPFLFKRLEFLMFAVAALMAEGALYLVVHRAMGSRKKNDGIWTSVAARIKKKHVEVAMQLCQESTCESILGTATELGDLSKGEQEKIDSCLCKSMDYRQVLKIVKKVGLVGIKTALSQRGATP